MIVERDRFIQCYYPGCTQTWAMTVTQAEIDAHLDWHRRADAELEKIANQE